MLLTYALAEPIRSRSSGAQLPTSSSSRESENTNGRVNEVLQWNSPLQEGH